MFELKQLNNKIVKPIITQQIPTETIKGFKLIPDLYSNIFICAKKQSGKTCTLFELIKNCCDKYTKVIIFCSTIRNDNSWSNIINYLNQHNIVNRSFVSLISKSGKNRIADLIHDIKLESEQEKLEDELKKSKEKQNEILLFDNKPSIDIKKRNQNTLHQNIC
jgi:hypothetical protein